MKLRQGLIRHSGRVRAPGGRCPRQPASVGRPLGTPSEWSASPSVIPRGNYSNTAMAWCLVASASPDLMAKST